MPYQPKGEGWSEMGNTEIWDLKEIKVGDLFFGIFQYKEEEIGENNSTLYTFRRFKTEDMEMSDFMGEWSIWGTTLLDIRFKNFEKGERVIVEYLGEEKSEKRKGKSYHNFRVIHKPPQEKKDDLDDVDLYDDVDLDSLRS